MNDTSRPHKAPPIPALIPRGAGHRFVFYGDSCSGVAAAPHEATHRAVNAMVARLTPQPEFIVFPGDEVMGLTHDMEGLRAQWRYWRDTEMSWLDPAIPVFHVTGNHTAYSPESEAVFAEMTAHLPRNGPAAAPGMAYAVRRGELLLVAVHTLDSRLGGEGHVDLDWLAMVLDAHADARWKLVAGHHPAWPVNGYAGDYMRTLGAEYRARFWSLLVRHGVTAYLCSHILAFDAQVHDGVLQITSAGAGTAHRMPEGVEYLHAVQMALDARGLRYQVLDTQGQVRERLDWPPPEPARMVPLAAGVQEAPVAGPVHAAAEPARVLHLDLRGQVATDEARRQTLIGTEGATVGSEPLWIGLSGPERRLTVTVQPMPGRSPHAWFGPALRGAFTLRLALHAGLGPGGILWRTDAGSWSSFETCASWGLERLDWPRRWCIGNAPGHASPFRGTGLSVAAGVV